MYRNVYTRFIKNREGKSREFELHQIYKSSSFSQIESRTRLLNEGES